MSGEVATALTGEASPTLGELARAALNRRDAKRAQLDALDTLFRPALAASGAGAAAPSPPPSIPGRPALRVVVLHHLNVRRDVPGGPPFPASLCAIVTSPGGYDMEVLDEKGIEDMLRISRSIAKKAALRKQRPKRPRRAVGPPQFFSPPRPLKRARSAAAAAAAPGGKGGPFGPAPKPWPHDSRGGRGRAKGPATTSAAAAASPVGTSAAVGPSGAAPPVKDQDALRAVDVASDPARGAAASNRLCMRCQEKGGRLLLLCSGQANCPIKARRREGTAARRIGQRFQFHSSFS